MVYISVRIILLGRNTASGRKESHAKSVHDWGERKHGVYMN